MERQPVTSGNIAAVGYDKDSKILEVEFRGSGAVYRYTGVEAKVFEQFMAVESKGVFFAHFIRGSYPYEKIQREEVTNAEAQTESSTKAAAPSQEPALPKAAAKSKRRRTAA